MNSCSLQEAAHMSQVACPLVVVFLNSLAPWKLMASTGIKGALNFNLGSFSDIYVFTCLGCSPGRRFILRLLSPVVCGLNSDRYMNFQTSDSYSSLASYNSDVSVEADLLSQKLTDFDVVDIAEELALIDKELLIRITWQELATCGWMSINKVAMKFETQCELAMFSCLFNVVTDYD